MAYGNMNPGLIIVRCVDSRTFRPVKGARAILTWLEGDASSGGRLTLYDTDGKPDPAPGADSDAAGVAFVKFLWDPTQIGYLLSDSPAIRLSAIGPAAHFSGVFTQTQDNATYLTTRVGSERLYVCVNLGQVWSGGQGEFKFREGGPAALDALGKIKEILSWRAKIAKVKLPSMPYLKVMRPSTEMVSLLGGFDVYMDPD